MSVSAITLGRRFLSRHRSRLDSRRVAAIDDDTQMDEDVEAPNFDEEEGSFVNHSNNSNTNTTNTTMMTPASQDNVENSDPTTSGAAATTVAVATDIEEGLDGENSDSEVDLEEVANDIGVNQFVVRPTLTLAELEEERELARRRSSACVLFAVFVLFRLWVLALTDGDFGLLVVCGVATSWTARWIRYNRDQEEELDRRIANYVETNGNTNEMPRDDLRMLSFQAQLALAIMESQRQMMQGGYGNGDGSRTPGVSDEAKGLWKKFSYKAARDKNESRHGSYGSVALDDTEKSGSLDEVPHCSICLGEYEENDELTKLPCSHIYHEECIVSWCTNHVRCPLCNFDLDKNTGATDGV